MTLTNKDVKIVCRSLWLFSIALIFIFYLIIWAIRNYLNINFIVIKNESIKDIMIMLGSFSITVTGFVAAIGAYILSLSHKPSFVKWKADGYLKPFYHLYGMCIIFLLITFTICMASNIIIIKAFMLKLSLCFFFVNLLHLVLLTLTVIGQSRNAENIK